MCTNSDCCLAPALPSSPCITVLVEIPFGSPVTAGKARTASPRCGWVDCPPPRAPRAIQIAWAHPEFGHIIAVGCDDGHVLVYVETPTTRLPRDGDDDDAAHDKTEWSLRLQARHTTSCITCVAFAPKQQGLLLAVGSADGITRCATPLQRPLPLHTPQSLHAGSTRLQRSLIPANGYWTTNLTLVAQYTALRGGTTTPTLPAHCCSVGVDVVDAI